MHGSPGTNVRLNTADRTEVNEHLVSAKRPAALLVCTRNRRDLFGEWLDAAARIKAPTDRLLYVVVADNNDTSDETWIREQASTRGIQIVYRHEPRAGFAYARNAALEAALTTDADLLIFVDDDDTPDSDLAAAHSDAIDRYGVDIVSGWIPARDAKMTEGGPANLISTGNAAFRRWVVDDAGLRFDPAFNRIGGEDSAFFDAALARGATAAYSRRARVVTFQHSDPSTAEFIATAKARNKIHARRIRRGFPAALSKYVRRYVPVFIAGWLMIVFGTVLGLSRLTARGRRCVHKHRFALQGLLHGGIDRTALKTRQIQIAE